MKPAQFTTILLFLFTFYFAPAQNRVTDSTTTIIPYWKKGEKKQFTLVKTNEEFTHGKLKSKIKVSYDAQIRVVQEKPEYYILEWTYLSVSDQEDAPPLVASLNKLTEGLKVIYKTDELGTFLEVMNWQQVRELVNKAAKKLVKETRLNAQQKAAFEKIMENFQTREAVEQLMVKEIRLYHNSFGIEAGLNEKIVNETEIPNTFGGDPFPAKVTVELTELRPADNFAKLVVFSEIDKEKGSEIIYDIVKQIASQGGNPVTEDAELPKLDISDWCEFEIELDTGWIQKATFTRTIEVDKLKKTTTTEIFMKH